MAKKGGIQQLQAEISNDEDFERFLDRYPDALLILDVYSEWCGPCLGVVNALKKAKLEMGGDKLQLAICKSDNITKLHRFYKRSEPTWLFIRNHKSVNLVFGSNVPRLLSVIKDELAQVDAPVTMRKYIEIEDLHPEEQKREKIKLEAKMAQEYKERYDREKKRRDYLMFCTNAILDNMPDMGVSVFGTHVNRDMFKKLNEPAEGLKMQCKDRRYQFVTKEDFQTANFVCSNPLPDDVIEQMTQNEVLICFWKISDELGHSVPHVMNQYVHELTKKVVEPPDEFNPEERVIPPIIEPMTIKVQYEVEDHEICPDDDDEPTKDTRPSLKILPTEEELSIDEEMVEEEEDEVPEDQGAMPAFDMPAIDFGINLDDLAGEEEGEDEMLPDEPPPKKICTKTVKMPAVWVPNDERSHAALVYVFFRAQTLPFLQPDPPPEPPHVIMAFDTYKKRDLISIAERNKNEIPMYGFFTSDDADEAKFIANSTQKYMQHTPSANDKIVFKVNKRTSHMMLSLATYGATYVSPNTTVGKEEALKFFPESFRTAEQDRQEAAEAQKTEGGKAATAQGEPEAEKTVAEFSEAEMDPSNIDEEIGEAAFGENAMVEGGAEGDEGEGGEGGEGEEGGEVGEGGEVKVGGEVVEGGEVEKSVEVDKGPEGDKGGEVVDGGEAKNVE